jgi:hypothetical protein
LYNADAIADQGAILGGPKLEVLDLRSSMHEADHRTAAIFVPLDGSLELVRGGSDGDILRIDRDLRSETTTNILRADHDRVFVDVEAVDQGALEPMGRLRRGVDHEAPIRCRHRGHRSSLH